ncbi:hypothetical protein M3E09_12950, partial [Dietzia cinnamea]|uniref:hypothetical protein n=1 Tax=Dietzia cinnamea TaxID=321318 RepID=UPI00223C4063
QPLKDITASPGELRQENSTLTGTTTEKDIESPLPVQADHRRTDLTARPKRKITISRHAPSSTAPATPQLTGS